MEALFPLGHTVATPASLQVLEDAGTIPQAILVRHQTGDWGDLDDEDKAANTRALEAGERILSAYEVAPNIRVWVITEWDRSSTTILLPMEY